VSCGNICLRIGSNAPAVLALEKRSVEKKKITEAQRKTGNQLRRNSLVLPIRAPGMGDYFTSSREV
jgi:hypothetical protein